VFSWNDWVDDLSRLKGYSYQVFDMQNDGQELWEHRIVNEGTIILSDVSVGLRFIIKDLNKYEENG